MGLLTGTVFSGGPTRLYGFGPAFVAATAAILIAPNPLTIGRCFGHNLHFCLRFGRGRLLTSFVPPYLSILIGLLVLPPAWGYLLAVPGIAISLLIHPGFRKDAKDKASKAARLTGAQRRLLRSMESRDPEERGRAAIDVGELGAKGEFAIPSLVELLEDPDSIVRANAVAAIGRIAGPGAEYAVLKLQGLLNVRSHEDRTVAIWAHFALARICGNAEEHVEYIFKGMKAVDVDVASAAANALGWLGPVANILDVLVKEFKVGTGGSSEGACLALGLMGPGARSAVPALRQAAQTSGYANVKRAAREALERIRGGNEP